MRLYIIRHADPDYENNTITPAGHLEAQALASRMAKEGLTHLYCSSMGRAKDTARYTANQIGTEPVVEDWACEISDCYYHHGERRFSVWDMPAEIVRGQAPFHTLEHWEKIDPSAAPVIQERFKIVGRCSDEFVARHGYQRDGGRYRIVKPNKDRIAFVCHNGIALFWLAHLLEIPPTLLWAGIWHAPSSVTTVLFEERSGEWAVPRAISVGDVSHLYAAGLPVRPRGIIANFD